MITPVKESAVVSPDSPINRTTEQRADPERIRVLLVDDDENFREAAALGLEDLGFDVTTIPDGDAMVRHFTDGNACDAIILDWRLPLRAGADYLRSLREHNVTVPVIILTGLPDTAYENIALDNGAHDFIDKSRGLLIVAKRVRRAVAARALSAAPSDASVSSGRLLLRMNESRAYWDGTDVNLTVTEFNIVRLMVASADKHVTYRDIYDCVHHPGFIAGCGEDGYRTNVRSAIKRIRNKFRALDGQFCQIENFSAFGYRWRSGPEEAAKAAQGDPYQATDRLIADGQACPSGGRVHRAAGTPCGPI